MIPKMMICLLMLLCITVHGADVGSSTKRPASGKEIPGMITSKGSKLFLNGKEYRAIGVNIPALPQIHMGTWLHIKQIYGTPEKARQAMVDAVIDAEKSGFTFVRFFASPGYPRDIDMLYAKDPNAYWRKMDEVFALCRERHLRVIPSLITDIGWFAYCGEPRQAVLDPNSRTYKATMTYIQQFVTRYKDDPTVLMWELTNEGLLAADVDMTGWDALPQEAFPPGMTARAKLTREDSLTWSMYQSIYKLHAGYIKSLDPNHLVTSGDGEARPECASRRETFPDFKYRNDTFREWLSDNLAGQLEPLDVYSFHTYGSARPQDSAHPWTGLNTMDILRGLCRVVHASNTPVFIGELGLADPSDKYAGNEKWTNDCIDVIEKEGVSLAALWAWHFPWQPDRTISSKTHKSLVARAARFNAKYSR